MAFLTILWNDILSRINNVSKTLQSSDIDLATVVDLFVSLEKYIQNLRIKFDYYEDEAKKQTANHEYREITSRTKKVSTRITFFDSSSSENTILKGKDKFRIDTFLTIINKLSVELLKRSKEYKEIFERFGFMRNILQTSDKDIILCCEKLCDFYPDDFERTTMASEFVHLKNYLEQKISEDLEIDIKTMYDLLYKENLQQVFPNLDIAMRIYLTIMPTNCSGERSFSYLNFIKNDKRNSLTQKKLNEYNSVLCIENDLLKSIDFSDVLEDFVSMKLRRAAF